MACSHSPEALSFVNNTGPASQTFHSTVNPLNTRIVIKKYFNMSKDKDFMHIPYI